MAEYVNQEKERERVPEDEIGLYDKWTEPKSRTAITYKKDKAGNLIETPLGFIEVINRDVRTSNLNEKEVKLVHSLMTIIFNEMRYQEMTKIDTGESVNFFANLLAMYLNVSVGRLAQLMKILKTSYAVSEEHKEERFPQFEEGKPARKKHKLGIFNV